MSQSWIRTETEVVSFRGKLLPALSRDFLDEF